MALFGGANDAGASIGMGDAEVTVDMCLLSLLNLFTNAGVHLPAAHHIAWRRFAKAEAGS